jgi:hypothetical protein
MARGPAIRYPSARQYRPSWPIWSLRPRWYGRHDPSRRSSAALLRCGLLRRSKPSTCSSSKAFPPQHYRLGRAPYLGNEGASDVVKALVRLLRVVGFLFGSRVRRSKPSTYSSSKAFPPQHYRLGRAPYLGNEGASDVVKALVRLLRVVGFLFGSRVMDSTSLLIQIAEQPLVESGGSLKCLRDPSPHWR